MGQYDERPDSQHVSPFDSIRRIAEDGSEYWSARDMAKLLGYTEYKKFKNAIRKTEIACESSGQAVLDHIAHVSDMIQVGKGARRKVDDVYLSRYVCYLSAARWHDSAMECCEPLAGRNLDFRRML